MRKHWACSPRVSPRPDSGCTGSCDNSSDRARACGTEVIRKSVQGLPFDMTPAARLEAAIEILGAGTAQALDRQLKAWFREHRFAGSKDRRAVAERVYG